MKRQSVPLLVVAQYLVGFFQAIILLVIIMFTSFHRKNRNASTIIYFFISTIVIFHYSSQEVQAHGNGAPKSRCDSMTPGHWVNAQKGLSPYQILVDKSVISPGDRVNITLKTIPGQTGFKGFFVMVKEAEDTEEEASDESGDSVSPNQNKNYGVFDLASSDLSQAQPVHCFEQRNSAMTHAINYVKDSVELYWIAPKLISEEDAATLQRNKDGRAYVEKELKIVATFVRDFWTYWADVEPVGDVRLLLTDTFQPKPPKISPKFPTPPPTLNFATPQLRGDNIAHLPKLGNGRDGGLTGSQFNTDRSPVQLDAEGGSSWSHFKRAWSFMTDLFGSGSS